MKKRNKLAALILAVAMVLSLSAVTAFAKEYPSDFIRLPGIKSPSEEAPAEQPAEEVIPEEVPAAEQPEELPAEEQPAEELPAEEQPTEEQLTEEQLTEEAPAAAPERIVTFSSDHAGAVVDPGTVITLTAHLQGFEGLTYTVRWEYTDDYGATIHTAGTGMVYRYTASEENENRLWRVTVDVDEPAESAAAAEPETAA